VPKWRLQLETSVQGSFDDGEATGTLPTGFRLGLPWGTELRVLSAVLSLDSDFISRADIAIGAKVELAEQARIIPTLAVVADILLPTGSNHGSAGTVVPDMRLLAAWSLPGDLSLLLNAGAIVSKDLKGRAAQLVYVANIAYAVTDRLGAFVEGFGLVDATGDRSSTTQIDWGVTLLVRDDVQIDLFAQHGLANAPVFQLALGASFLL